MRRVDSLRDRRPGRTGCAFTTPARGTILTAVAGFLLFLGDAAKHVARSGRGRPPCWPDAALEADAAVLLALGTYDPYVDYAWNGSHLSDLERKARALLASREEAALHHVLARTRRGALEPWHQPMLDAALGADSAASFARELLALIDRARTGSGTVVYSSD